jgi:hypothetical protein
MGLMALSLLACSVKPSAPIQTEADPMPFDSENTFKDCQPYDPSTLKAK